MWGYDPSLLRAEPQDVPLPTHNHTRLPRPWGAGDHRVPERLVRMEFWGESR
jgi:hypothetical protein